MRGRVPRLNDFAQTHVQRLHRIRRVDHPPDVVGQAKHRDDPRPVRPPRLADRGVAPIPLLGESRQLVLGFVGDRAL